MFIGWWQETGLALLNCAMCSSAVSALQPLKTPPYRAREGILMHHLGGLPNGRPRRYVHYTTGPMDHHSPNSSPTLDRVQRLRRHEGLQVQR